MNLRLLGDSASAEDKDLAQLKLSFSELLKSTGSAYLKCMSIEDNVN